MLKLITSTLFLLRRPFLLRCTALVPLSPSRMNDTAVRRQLAGAAVRVLLGRPS